MKKIFLFSLLFSITAHATLLSELVVDSNQPIIIGDKTSGKLFVYTPQTQKLISSPALYGQKLADVDPNANYDTGQHVDKVTPAGTFMGRKYISARLNEPVFAFILGKASMIAIHPVYLGLPQQRRVERLASLDPAEHRITNGCVNVPTAFYLNVLDKLRTNTTVIMLKEGDVLVNNIVPIVGNQDQTVISTKYGDVDTAGDSGYSGNIGN